MLGGEAQAIQDVNGGIGYLGVHVGNKVQVKYIGHTPDETVGHL